MDADVVIFPYFDARPGDPEFICCENLALRSEFEKWPLRDIVVGKVRDFWTQQYHRAESFVILAENKNFLIVENKLEDRVLLHFLNHLLAVVFTKKAWKKFLGLVLTIENGSIDINRENNFYWNVDTAKGDVSLQIKNVRRDSVTVPMVEWQNLQELLT